EIYRSCFRASAAALMLARPSGEILEVSQGAELLFGYGPGEMLVHRRSTVVPHDELMMRALAQSSASGSIVAEVTAVRKDGSHFIVRCQSNRFVAAGGETLVSVAFADITAQKRIEDTARLLDYNLQLVLDNTDEPLALIDGQFRLITFNKAAVVAFQMLHKGALKNGDDVLESIAPSGRSYIRALFEAVLRGEPQEVLRKHALPDGSVVVYRTRLRPLFKEATAIGIILNAKDVTRKFLAEEALRKSNERFQRAAEASYDIIWEHDMPSNRIMFTESFERLLGYTGCTEWNAEDFLQHVVHPDDAAQVASKAIAFVESTGMHLFYPVHRLRKKDGSFIYVEANAIASRDAAGHAYRLTGVTRDITAQHLMEMRLTESNRRYELAAGASIDLVYE
ncbi:MAG: PAS domain S-box protein, partial [Sphingobacteriales bacterium]